MKLDDLNLFRLVVENGSYTATSRKTMILLQQLLDAFKLLKIH
ncbi:Cyn operon transcriptional activator [Vibrio variabilis]|uniref:Cyn operon transcriptional activator n=1 Tax=Vibrio variabilis TaxID=990271 RepID=A0ABQ0J8P3_9VIBR|nr:Cyn operon transcriptional activator [Vibrio variabilis]